MYISLYRSVSVPVCLSVSELVVSECFCDMAFLLNAPAHFVPMCLFIIVCVLLSSHVVYSIKMTFCFMLIRIQGAYMPADSVGSTESLLDHVAYGSNPASDEMEMFLHLVCCILSLFLSLSFFSLSFSFSFSHSLSLSPSFSLFAALTLSLSLCFSLSLSLSLSFHSVFLSVYLCCGTHMPSWNPVQEELCRDGEIQCAQLYTYRSCSRALKDVCLHI